MIEQILGDILSWFDAEDKELLMAAWQSIFDLMLTPYQDLLEKEMSSSITTVVPLKKKFYEVYRMTSVTTASDVATLPHRLPVGYSNVKAYGESQWVTKEVTLPIDLGEYAEEISTNDEVTLDGTKILGSGTITVTYKTTYMGAGVVSNGYLTGPVGLTNITLDAPALPAVDLRGTGEVLSDQSLYDPSHDFSQMDIGKSITLNGGYTDTIAEIVDRHTIKATSYLPLMTTWVGKQMDYVIQDAFPYTIATDAYDIPEIGNYRVGIDYVILDGVIAFAKDPGTELLIAYLSFYPNPDLSDEWGAMVDYRQTDISDTQGCHKRLVALWHSIFDVSDKRRIEFMLSAFLGMPYIGPWGGESVIEEIQYEYTSKAPPVDFTFGTKYNDLATVYPESDYFFSGDKFILLDGGRFLRIAKVVSATEVLVEGFVPTGTATGSTGDFTFDWVFYRNSKGGQVIISTPINSCPLYIVGETIPIWSKMFSGVRVRDRVSRKDYEVADHTRFYDTGATSDLPAVLRMLAANTFVIEVDGDFIDLSRLEKVQAAWTQYQTIGRSDWQAIALDDRAILEIAFSYIFVSGYSPMVPIAPLFPVNENNCWVNQAQPRIFDGTIGPGTTWGLEFDGALKVTIPANNKFNIARNYTIMTRVKFDTIAGNQPIFMRKDQFRFGMEAGELYFDVWYLGAWVRDVSVGAGIIWNTWYTATVVITDTDVTFHIDKTFAFAIAHSVFGVGIGTKDIYIGYDSVSGNYLTGKMDFCHMWAVPLTQSEIDLFINSGVFPYEDYQIARYDFNTGSGSTAVDTAPYYGYEIDGNTHYISLHTTYDEQFYAPKQLSVAARVFITSFNTLNRSLSIISSSVILGTEDWEVRLDEIGGLWKFQFLTGGVKYTSTVYVSLPEDLINQWFNVVVIIDGVDCRMYLKAKSGTPFTVSETLVVPTDRAQAGTSAEIGKALGSSSLIGSKATAILRDVTVWTYAVTSTERDEYINEGDPRIWDQVLNMPLDETSGATVTDYADNHMVVI